MRCPDWRPEDLFGYMSLERRVPVEHPLRSVPPPIDGVLSGPSPAFQQPYAGNGWPSISPEKLLRALLLQAFCSARSEQQPALLIVDKLGLKSYLRTSTR